MAALPSSLIILCVLVSNTVSIAISNSVYGNKATAFLTDLLSFYAGTDKSSFSSHIADDFIWRWESDRTVGKEKFIAFNKDFYRHYKTADTQYIIDAYGEKYCAGISYGFFSKKNNPVFACKQWLFSYEIFIFNDEQQIKERYSFPVEKRVYEDNIAILSSPQCRRPRHNWDYEAEDALNEKLLARMTSFYNHTLHQYVGKLDDTQEFFMDIADGFSWYNGAEYNQGKEVFVAEMRERSGVYEQAEIQYEMDVWGQGYAAGYAFTMLRKGNCHGVFTYFVVTYFDWDLDKITHLAQLPVDQEALREFEQCVSWEKYEKQEL